MKKHRENAADSVIFLTAVSALSQLLSFGYRVAMSRMVGAEVMGLYQLLMSAYAVLQSVTMVGLTAAVSNLTSQYLARHNGRGAAKALSCALGLFFLLLLPAAALVLLFSDGISVYLLGDARTRLGLVLLLPCAALTGVENLHKHHFYGAGRVRAPAAVNLAEQCIRAGAVLTLLWVFLPQYPERAAGFDRAGNVGVRGVLIPDSGGAGGALEKEGGPVRPGGIRGRVPPEAGGGGAAHWGHRPAGQPAGGGQRRPDPPEAGGGGTEPVAGAGGVRRGVRHDHAHAGCAHGVSGGGLAGGHPAAGPGGRSGAGRRIRALTGRTVRAVSLLALPAMALMAAAGGDLGVLLFRQERAGEFILPLAGVMALCCWESALNSILSGVGRQRQVAAVSILSGGVQAAVTFSTAAKLGMAGYVLGAAVSALLGLGLSFYLTEKYTGTRPDWMEWFWMPGLAALLAGLNARLLLRVDPGYGHARPVGLSGRHGLRRGRISGGPSGHGDGMEGPGKG